jgi:hypothetical protein
VRGAGDIRENGDLTVVEIRKPEPRRRNARSLGCRHDRGKALDFRAGRLVVQAVADEPVSSRGSGRTGKFEGFGADSRVNLHAPRHKDCNF